MNAVPENAGPLLGKKADLSQITVRHTLQPEADAPVEPGDTLGELTEVADGPVKLGRAEAVTVQLGDAAGLLIDKAQKSGITTEVATEESVTAPVSQGQRIGTLTVKAGEQVLSEVPLVAAEGVDRLSWGDLFVKVLMRTAMAKA